MLSAKLRTMVEEHSKEYCGTLTNMCLGNELNKALKTCLESFIDRINYEFDNDLIALSYKLIKMSKQYNDIIIRIKEIEGKNVSRPEVGKGDSLFT